MNVWVLKMDDTDVMKSFGDPEVGIKAYIEFIESRIPDDFNDPKLMLESSGDQYSAYYDGEFVSSLTRMSVIFEPDWNN
jgi:hypothetical protein